MSEMDKSMEYYDNEFESLSIDENMVKFERVYSVNFSTFEDKNWNDLVELYKSLPQYIDEKDLPVPYWFGIDEDKPPYVWASVEPSGLIVNGVLSRELLSKWHDKLMNSTIELPMNKFS